MLSCGYYSLTYGVNLYIKEKNKLAGIAMISLSVLGTLIPAVVMVVKS
jgi:hypothetical protein